MEGHREALVSNYVQDLVWNAEIPNANAKLIADQACRLG